MLSTDSAARVRKRSRTRSTPCERALTFVQAYHYIDHKPSG